MLENVFELSDIGTVLSCLSNDFVFDSDFYPCFWYLLFSVFTPVLCSSFLNRVIRYELFWILVSSSSKLFSVTYMEHFMVKGSSQFSLCLLIESDFRVTSLVVLNC